MGYLKVFKYLFNVFYVQDLKVFEFLYFPKVVDFFKYIVSINISLVRLQVALGYVGFLADFEVELSHFLTRS